MSKFVQRVKVKFGIPVTMTGKDFIDLNGKLFTKNGNNEEG